MASQPRRVTDRERFLTFALAAAEILLEVTPDGRIDFAAGALQSRLGAPPDSFVGRPLRDLLAVADRTAFEVAFNRLLARDRLPPTQFRLADAKQTPMSFAGLRLVGQDSARVCLTLAAMPAQSGAAAPAGGPAAFRDAAESAGRDAHAGGTLGLIEWRAADGSAEPPADLAELIRETLSTALSQDGVAGELAAGRYGLIAGESTDIAAIGARLAEVTQAAGHAASVSTHSLSLQAEGLTPMQTTRALRHALASFARDGQAALDKAGFADGLAGFVAEAYARAVWLRRAIAERRFRMAFQPIVALHGRAPHHWEALLRPDPDATSPVSGPQDFVTYAETAGLSEELDWAVLAAVCGAARTARGTRIAANLSGLTLQSALFRDRLLALLDAEPLLAHRLVIEITETAEIEDEAEAVRTVEALRARGLPLCIDDFGAGAAAFRYLRAFRVDYVKIDGLYVANAARSDQDRGIVAGMVDLARTVGAKVVAERIETEAEAALMQELGVEYGQGWLFGRPGPLPG